jgi:hypothetical protein
MTLLILYIPVSCAIYISVTLPSVCWLQWCEQDERCHRLQLNDLLISPMQHCTKVPLLLNNIRRYTEEQREQKLLTVSLQKLETSLR